MSLPVDAPVAIITGSASGTGLAVVKMLVSRGYGVMMADWNYKKCSQESAPLGPSTAAVKCDVSSWHDQLEVFGKTVELWGEVDLVGANAGIPEYRLLKIGSRHPRMPPGPPTIPILGNAHQIPITGLGKK